MAPVYLKLTDRSIVNRPCSRRSVYARLMQDESDSAGGLKWSKERRREFGARLAAARLAKGLTLQDVGAEFGIGKAAAGHWETGTNTPSAERLAYLCEMLGESADWFLFGRRPEKSAPATELSLSQLALHLAAAAGKLKDGDKRREMLDIAQTLLPEFEPLGES